MADTEYMITESFTSPKSNDDDHQVLAMNMGLEAFGLITDVAEAKATLMVKNTDGSHRFTVVDFNRERDVQLQVSTRNINSDIYGQLSGSFDRMVESFNPKQIENKSE